ncbi:C39 family peptidase [Anatilimnocola floriformis]|uniref:C39 family peptidase n=1 Tax=Anatilimnocola floriformis TaxID=2948575 RepID=UPI0020C3E197|nr:cysteine peptidase family C39 domain-containing protein [Anatilimnocola floriformis]
MTTPIRLPVFFAAAYLGMAPLASAEKPDVVRYPSPQRNFNATLQPWTATKSRNVMLQEREYTCGAASLGTLLRYYFEDPVSEERILDAAMAGLNEEQIKDREKNGLSMEDLARGAGKLQYAAAVLKLEYAKLATLPAPVVIRLIKDDFKHFVVFRGEREGMVYVADPIRGNVKIPLHLFKQEWDGNVLAVIRRGMQPRTQHPLQIPPDSAVLPQAQAARRGLLENSLPLRPIR